MPRSLLLIRAVVCLLAWNGGTARIAVAAVAAVAASDEPQAPPFTAADSAVDGPYVYAEPSGGWTVKRIVKVDREFQPLVEKAHEARTRDTTS